ncbi:MAG: glycosyltransferase family 2 protein [Planctomycetales bacterium]|nr:glycosyltransferase family 2 protein [Planctomycetales bacterium]
MTEHRSLTVLPVFNEVKHVHAVLDEVRLHSQEVLVVDDGSTDGTADELKRRSDIQVISHEGNQGYGAALRTAFQYAAREGYWAVVTVDCDGQHEPQRIPRFLAALQGADIVSGSRYLKQYQGDSEPPGQRRWVNQVVTAELNELLGLSLTDAFCGFKAYRVDALRQLEIQEPGYAMPLELWVRAAFQHLEIIELPVPLIYLDEKRSFGGALDDAMTRLDYYRSVICASYKQLCREGSVAPVADAAKHCVGQ